VSTAAILVIALVLAGVGLYFWLRPSSSSAIDTSLPALGSGDPATASKGGNIIDGLEQAFGELFPWTSHTPTGSAGTSKKV
jgi:hypothetical protein